MGPLAFWVPFSSCNRGQLLSRSLRSKDPPPSVVNRSVGAYYNWLLRPPRRRRGSEAGLNENT
eukprot:4779009-Alexandrium_andersonii.AAC.1